MQENYNLKIQADQNYNNNRATVTNIKFNDKISIINFKDTL